MKKFYFFMMALLVSLSSMAWTVKFTNPEGWATVSVWAWDDAANYTGGVWPGATMTQDGDVWTYEGEGTPAFVIFSNNGSPQTGNLAFVEGATYNMLGVEGAATETYTVYFDNSKSNWAAVYAYGWNGVVTNGWPGNELTKNADGLYEFSFEATSAPDGGSIIFNNGVGGSVGVDQTDDLDYVAGKTYDVNGLVGGGDTPIDPDPVDNKTYKLNGQITGNDMWEAVDLVKNEDGNWEYTGNFVAGEFGIQIMEDGKQIGWIGGAATVVAADEAYPFAEGANSSSTLEGAYTFVYNPTASTVTFVTYQGEITIVKTYALRGNIVTGEWDDYAMTEKNGAWEVELTVVPGEFGIKYMENDSQKAWYAAPTADDAAMDAAGTFTTGSVGTTNWASTLEGLYTFSFNPETEVLTVTKATTGIESIEAEEAAEAVYYNLQGVRVANPENGLYIRVAGKTASKVFIR